MNGNSARIVRFSAGLAGLVLLGWVLTGQAAKPVTTRISLTTDWSHRHLIFSPSPAAEVATRAAEDPRYWQQLNRRAARRIPPVEVPQPQREVPQGEVQQSAEPLGQINGWGGPPNHFPWGFPPPPPPVGRPAGTFHRDWAEDLGSGGALTASVFPAKYSFDINAASCATDPNPDFVVYSTGLSSSPATQASIVAYDNLYSGCTGSKPTTYWAYDTTGQILTSPAFSLDGSQIVFAQTSSSLGILVVLKWATSSTATVTNPQTLVPVLPSLYRSCPAPCMTTITLQDNLGVPTDDTTSSVFVDYANDVAWVGGAGGWLHKITGVFNGTPTEVTTGGFPVQMAGGSALSSPVYDHVSGNVFVGDASGFLYNVNSTTAAVAQSGQVDFSTGGVVDSPIVDSAGRLVYVFSSADGTSGCPGTADCAGVFQFGTSFGSGDPGSEVQVGASTVEGVSTPNPMYSGAFDSTYYSSLNRTGNLYVCGNTGGPPILYQVPISLGVMQTPNALPVLSNSITPCSPVSDIQNPNASGGTTEWIFVSAQLNGISNGCSSAGCIFNFRVTPWVSGFSFAQNEEVLDSHRNIQAAMTGGTSGGGTPNWAGAVGKTTTDGAVTWQTLGPLSAITPPGWMGPGHAYMKGNIILDGNNELELCTTAGNSGFALPTWATTVGATTIDGPVRWKNLGANPTAALTAPGGTTGIIMDNIVSSGTLAGASQVYFSTLGSQSCTGGTGSCAVQASQPGLK